MPQTLSEATFTCAACDGEATEDTGQAVTVAEGGSTQRTTQVYACPCGALRITKETTDKHITASAVQITTDSA